MLGCVVLQRVPAGMAHVVLVMVVSGVGVRREGVVATAHLSGGHRLTVTVHVLKKQQQQHFNKLYKW